MTDAPAIVELELDNRKFFLFVHPKTDALLEKLDELYSMDGLDDKFFRLIGKMRPEYRGLIRPPALRGLWRRGIRLSIGDASVLLLFPDPKVLLWPELFAEYGKEIDTGQLAEALEIFCRRFTLELAARGKIPLELPERKEK